MAQSQIALAFGAGFAWIETALGSTPEQVKATAPTVFMIEVDNSANPLANAYFKAWFALSASVTLGTTDPDMVIDCLPGKKLTIIITGAGLVFTTGLTVACVTTGGTGGVTAPANPVAVKVVYS